MHTAAHAQLRITRLAATLPVHRAFHWLHLHQPQLRLWLLDLLAIPAPPFGESARAQWFLERFTALGLANPHLDAAGNALAELPAPDATPDSPVVLLSAHLDTVFPPETPSHPTEDGPRIHAPGACDNGAGLTALLALVAALRFAGIVSPTTILFAANVGEEGEGNLRGMRHLFLQGPYRGRIHAALALEGAGSGAVTSALGSRRFRVSATGPGGHSWTDAGAPNPILALARAIVALDTLILPDIPRTTLNIGRITGGTSINSIPESAAAHLDLRSTDPTQLARTEADLRHLLSPLPVELIGERPTGSLPPDAPLLRTLRAVDRHLGLRTEPRIGSTDANIPLSLDIPALAIGTGGTGAGIHTLAEWYDPTGREIALRRILLLLLATLPPH